jgi:hypothetical protein
VLSAAAVLTLFVVTSALFGAFLFDRVAWAERPIARAAGRVAALAGVSVVTFIMLGADRVDWALLTGILVVTAVAEVSPELPTDWASRTLRRRRPDGGATEATTLPRRTSSRWLREQLGSTAVMLLACLSIAVQVANLAGRLEARARTGYLVLHGDRSKDEADWVVLRIYDDKMVCAPLAGPINLAAPNTVYGRLRVLPVGDDPSQTFDARAVGPLTSVTAPAEAPAKCGRK